MALLERTDTLAAIREKVEANERLDFEDGLTLMESDDLLALGELADLARRRRGGGEEVVGLHQRQPVLEVEPLSRLHLLADRGQRVGALQEGH